jgi:alpha-D-ribose 1-methylphosphonate 5-triphosphate synthase subunit PhnH
MDRHADGQALLVTTVSTAPPTGLVDAAISVLLTLYDQHFVAYASSEETFAAFTGRDAIVDSRGLVSAYPTQW